MSDLSPNDRATLDALIEHGFDPAQVPEPLRERARRVMAMFEGLDTPEVAVDPALLDVTELVIQRTGDTRAELEPHTAEALDAWVMSGYAPERVPGSLRARAERLEKIGHALEDVPVSFSSDLVDRTLSRIEGDQIAREQRFRIPSRVRLADLISVAAVLLIGASLMLPVMSGAAARGERNLCEANFAGVAGGMGMYATDHRSLPRVAEECEETWIDVGSTPRRSNSANLYLLPLNGYVDLEALACPGNPDAPDQATEGARDWRSLEEVSYSYQIMFGKARPTWKSGDDVLLTDRSPVILKVVRGEAVNPFANSPNHGGSGQHVLKADGSAVWMRSPTRSNGDNLWFPREVERQISALLRNPIRGSETPSDAHDAFVGP